MGVLNRMALKGVKVLEIAGMAPSPLCGMILSDFGASVIRIDRTGKHIPYDITARGKKSIAVNLRVRKGAEIVRQLSKNTDILLEGFRPGVMEKLGLGPTILMKQNPQLIFARITGYGQQGPMSNVAGHDINYLAMSGVLSRLGRRNENPNPPINLLAAFAGGSMTCAMGIMAALFERSISGHGQVIDSSMVEGSAYVSSWLFKSQTKLLVWGKDRGENILDGGAHYYEIYRTSDDKYIAIGAIEPHFYDLLLEKLHLTKEKFPQTSGLDGVNDFDADILKDKLQEIIKTKTRGEWAQIFDGTDACVTPVLELHEAPNHPHSIERQSFIRDTNGEFSPAPAPKLSRTPAVPNITDQEPNVGQNTVEILSEELGIRKKK